ncbi:hypothetical protein [Haloarcula onubensis]|uniref:Uncharacterized protein n=1 Tax=Haloarcula onubensis TaxID=2950539 RepID=A0ABU2FV45_9EURY|nr:hypothetical protein [Halomicroarcula sp. S3CR25-11]MDS0284630.1 hypothetical protein [Halomicroarcula sp. S3CR25-11]
MSTLDPSTPRLPAPSTDADRLVGKARRALSGAAFWASIPLPLVILAVLLSGVATAAPAVLVGLVVLNVCCAALGHSYTPTR